LPLVPGLIGNNILFFTPWCRNQFNKILYVGCSNSHSC